MRARRTDAGLASMSSVGPLKAARKEPEEYDWSMTPHKVAKSTVMTRRAAARSALRLLVPEKAAHSGLPKELRLEQQLGSSKAVLIARQLKRRCSGRLTGWTGGRRYRWLRSRLPAGEVRRK